MKILYIITKSNFGGAQKYVFELATRARENGHDVTVAFGGTGEAHAETGLLENKLSEAQITTVTIRNFKRNMSPWLDLKALVEVFFLIRHTKPDVLHVTSSKAGGIGAFTGRLARIKNIVFTSHGLTMDETWRPKWQQTLIHMSTWLTLFLAHHSIMISTETYERTKKMPLVGKKVSLIKNGAVAIDFEEKAHARKALAPEVPQRSLWIGGVGELHQNKNWSALIQAMINLPQNTHLIIIGEGEERSSLEERIKANNLEERVHLLGFRNAPAYFKAFDIFVLPSKKEGLPYVLLEAGLASLPTIASDLPGNHDIIETGKDGFLIEPTPNLLSTTLEILIRDEGMRRVLGDNLRNKVEATFSIKEMYQRTIQIYDSRTSDV